MKQIIISVLYLTMYMRKSIFNWKKIERSVSMIELMI